MPSAEVTLPRDTNQAQGLGRLALDFLDGRLGTPGEEALLSLERFHLDSVACAVSALALGANAPTVLRREAHEYAVAAGQAGATCIGSRVRVHPEKAVAANCAAVREWDANGTNFGFNPRLGHVAGEFGHNDFYPVVVAAAQMRAIDGSRAALAMLLLDEIRGRLAECFSLKDHRIDHVVHGAIASTVIFGALLGALPEQIESALGLLVAHYIPFRAIRAGKQLSDSKGASAALSAEMAVVSVRRALRGFVGPADIFRNPEAIFCLYQPPASPGESPFDLTLSTAGDDFAIRGMHFKLGLYEHQSAGAIQGLIELLQRHPGLLADEARLVKLRIKIYQPAFGIIGDPAKRDPRTRQSADHSMVYIIATLLRKAFTLHASGWKELMLTPSDYDLSALADPLTRKLMERIEFVHGGPDYDAKYPDGIPTSLEIDHAELGALSSGLIMYPAGHARYAGDDLLELLNHKFQLLAALGVDDHQALRDRCCRLRGKSALEMAELYAFEVRSSATS